MGYAVIGYFDKETDKVIRELWKILMNNGIDDYLYNSENNPHIKFIMYENFDWTQGILNIDMAVSIELLKLQSTIRKKCDKYSRLFPIDFFDRGMWKPDCQLRGN